MAIKSTIIGTTNTVVYTSTVTGTQVGNAITTMIICNYGSVAANLTMYAVPNSGGSVGSVSSANTIINSLNIPVGETVSLDQEKLVLDPNDTIVAACDHATTLTITISTLPV
jgi:hypothetical protein